MAKDYPDRPKQRTKFYTTSMLIGYIFMFIGTFLLVLSFIFRISMKQSYTFAMDLQSQLFAYAGVGLLVLGVAVTYFFYKKLSRA